jgi:hypothetical protein
MGSIQNLENKLWDLLSAKNLFNTINVDHTRGVLQVICHIINPHFIKNLPMQPFEEPELNFQPFYIKSY